jgi:hypothetical protein
MEQEFQEHEEPEAVEDVDALPVVEDESSQPVEGGEPQLSTEERARAQGWRPKEEYNGDPDRWVDAEAFVKRGEQELPVVRERNRHLESRVTELNQKLEQTASTIANMERMNRVAVQRAVQREREQLAQEYGRLKEQAVEFGDVDQFRNLEMQERQHLSQFDSQAAQDFAQQQPQQAPANVYDMPEVQTWVNENPWFETNREMHNMAVSVSQAIGGANPTMPMADVLKQTAQRMRAIYPDKFGGSSQPQRPSMPSVEGSASRGAAVRQSTRGAAQLPPEARKQGQEFVSDGLFKNLDEYARSYFEQGDA